MRDKAVQVQVQVHFGVDPDEVRQIDAAAEAEGRTRANWLRARVREALGAPKRKRKRGKRGKRN